MNSIVIDLAISFVLRQLEKYGAATDFNQVKKDLEPRIRKAVPGTWLDPVAVRGANKVIDVLAAIVADTAILNVLVSQVRAGDVTGATKTVKNFIANASNDDFVKALFAA